MDGIIIVLLVYTLYEMIVYNIQLNNISFVIPLSLPQAFSGVITGRGPTRAQHPRGFWTPRVTSRQCIINGDKNVTD